MPAKSKKSQSISNPFTPLKSDMETKEKEVHQESQSDLHKQIDSVWKFLISGRQKCRSLQYQFWAAVLIEKNGLEKDDGGLEGLIESILIDPKMGDQHIAKLPMVYHDKMRLCTTKTFLEDKDIKGNVNKYAAFLQRWHGDLKEEIKKQLSGNYLIKDSQGNDIINPKYRDEIKKIIADDPLAKKIRKELNLSEHLPLEAKEEKSSKPKPKTGMDYYLDYLLTDDNEVANSLLEQAVKLGYVESGSDNTKSKTIISDEYYLNIARKYFVEGKDSLAEKILLSGATKGSAAAQFILSTLYDKGFGDIKVNKVKAVKYCEMAANKGFAPAQHNLAYNCFDGFGTNKDINRGLDLLKKAAAQGYADSQNDLANRYKKGDVIEKNIDEAINLWKKAIEQGISKSKAGLGTHYLEIGNIKEGIKLLKEAAEEGIVDAQFAIGSAYMDGMLIEKDTSKGHEWIAKAAKQNHAGALKFIKTFSEVKKYPEYYILINNITVTDKIVENIIKILTSAGLSGNNLKDVIEVDWVGFKIPLPSEMMKKEVREALNIDRVRIDKIDPEQEKVLQLQLPKATIENDPDDVNKMLITWPKDERVKTREIIDKFIKSPKAKPELKIEKPLAKTMGVSTTSQVKQ